MAQFYITIADADVNRVIGAMCANYGYQSNVSNPNFNPGESIDSENNPEHLPNPETTSQFANRMTRDFLMNNTVAHELKVEKENVSIPTPPDITNPE